MGVTGVIYEKIGDMDRTKMLLPVNREREIQDKIKLSVTDSRAVEYKRESLPPSTSTPIPKAKIKNTLRESRRNYPRKRRVASKLFLVIFTLLFCVATLDVRFFDGNMTHKLSSFAAEKLSTVLSQIEEEKDVPNIGSDRTLYTLTYAQEKGQVFDAADNSLFEDEEMTEELPQISEQTEAVCEEIPISGGVDGTRLYPISELDLSGDVMSLSNGTAFEPDLYALSEKTPACVKELVITQEPLVLIVSTHALECYSESDDMYPETEPTRSYDNEKNVLRVGREIADTLSDFGISSVHCLTQHDGESFINAYTNSASTVKEYLSKCPSIRFVIDVHRDAIIREDKESIKAVTRLAGQKYAQLMLVVGTNELGHNHPDWQENLSFAIALQNTVEQSYPGLCRSINLRNVPFNQQLCSGYLLLEVGTSANKLDEALLSARAFGQSLARFIKDNAV